MRLLRPLFAALGVLALGIVAASCSAVRPVALSVNGHDISQSSVVDELKAIAGNKDLHKDVTTPSNAMKPSATALWLTTRAYGEIAQQEVDRKNLRVTASDRTNGRAQAAQFFGSEQTFKAFPGWFQKDVAGRFASWATLARAETKPPTEAQIRAEYDQRVGQLKSQCRSGRFVAHILVATRDQADALESQLATGADFATLAKQSSTDQNSASVGGELGCLDGLQVGEPFNSTASALALNQVSQPLQLQSGWDIVLVRDTIPFDSVKDAIRAAIEQQQGDATPLLAKLAAKQKVTVASQYGTWVVKGGQGRVEPPKGAVPSTTTTTPATTTP